jgi:hypothetical protein
MGVTIMYVSHPHGDDSHWHLNYNRRVRGTDNPVYLWGSKGLTVDLSFVRPPLLHLLNDAAGEPVTISTQASAGPVLLGSLQPGECVSISLQNISGVFAKCDLESNVRCLVKP